MRTWIVFFLKVFAKRKQKTKKSATNKTNRNRMWWSNVFSPAKMYTRRKTNMYFCKSAYQNHGRFSWLSTMKIGNKTLNLCVFSMKTTTGNRLTGSMSKKEAPCAPNGGWSFVEKPTYIFWMNTLSRSFVATVKRYRHASTWFIIDEMVSFIKCTTKKIDIMFNWNIKTTIKIEKL